MNICKERFFDKKNKIFDEFNDRVVDIMDKEKTCFIENDKIKNNHID